MNSVSPRQFDAGIGSYLSNPGAATMRMVRRRAGAWTAFAILMCGVGTARAADEYRVEQLNEAASTEGVAPEIAAQLAPAGFKLVKGTSRTQLSFWPVKEVTVKDDFQPSAALLYPLEMGQLIGLAVYKRDGEDFRGQEIPAGTYTVRFALQPEDGNHVGTSDTRDFLLLLKAEDDKSPAVVPKESLFKLSALAAGTTHPCMLALLSADGASGETPTIEHDETRELWSIVFGLKTKGGALTIKPVFVGKAAE